MLKGTKTRRHEKNPTEKEIHDRFIDEIHDRTELLEAIAFDNVGKHQLHQTLSLREKEIMINTIQWIGSSVGIKFIEDCGFKKTER